MSLEKLLWGLAALSPVWAGTLSYVLYQRGVSFELLLFALGFMSLGLGLFWKRWRRGGVPQDCESVRQDLLIQEKLFSSLTQRVQFLSKEKEWLGDPRSAQSTSAVAQQAHASKHWQILHSLIRGYELLHHKALPLSLQEWRAQAPRQPVDLVPHLMESLTEAEKLCAKPGVMPEGTILGSLRAPVEPRLLRAVCRFPWVGFSLLARHGSAVVFSCEDRAHSVVLKWTNGTAFLPEPVVELLNASRLDTVFKSLRAYFLHLEEGKGNQHDKLEGFSQLVAVCFLARSCGWRCEMKSSLKGPFLLIDLPKSGKPQ